MKTLIFNLRPNRSCAGYNNNPEIDVFLYFLNPPIHSLLFSLAITIHTSLSAHPLLWRYIALQKLHSKYHYLGRASNSKMLKGTLSITTSVEIPKRENQTFNRLENCAIILKFLSQLYFCLNSFLEITYDS